MSRVAQVMQAFQRELRRWIPHVARVTYSNIDFNPLVDGSFKAVARWKNKDGSDGHFEKVYDRREIFGDALMQRSPRQKICRFSDELAKAILAARGV